MSRRIVQNIDYSATPGDGDTIELRIVRESISFVEEIIPDGQLAGMKGHREVPCTDEMVLILYPGQAQALYEELGRALRERQGPRS